MAGITNAEISDLSLSISGKNVIDLLKSEECANLFDLYRAHGSDKLVDSATAPEGGEQIDDEPGYAVGAAATVTYPFLPILFPKNGYKLSKTFDAPEGIKL